MPFTVVFYFLHEFYKWSSGTNRDQKGVFLPNVVHLKSMAVARYSTALLTFRSPQDVQKSSSLERCQPPLLTHGDILQEVCALMPTEAIKCVARSSRAHASVEKCAAGCLRAHASSCAHSLSHVCSVPSKKKVFECLVKRLKKFLNV